MRLQEYTAPNFSEPTFQAAPDVTCVPAAKDGLVPRGYHATSIYPEYFKISGKWRLIQQSRMDCAVVVREGEPYAVEHRNIRAGDAVAIGRTETGGEGIFVHMNGFGGEVEEQSGFAFRGSRTRETSYSRDYDSLYELLRYEREHGFTVWVLGPACTFDFD